MINVVLWCTDKRWRNPKGQLWMDNSEIITTLATKDTRRRQKQQTNKQTNNHRKLKIWTSDFVIIVAEILLLVMHISKSRHVR